MKKAEATDKGETEEGDEDNEDYGYDFKDTSIFYLALTLPSLNQPKI